MLNAGYSSLVIPPSTFPANVLHALSTSAVMVALITAMLGGVLGGVLGLLAGAAAASPS